MRATSWMKLIYALMAISLCGPVEAAVYQITMSWTVTGTDTTGVFGTPGALSGAYTVSYFLNYPTPGSTDMLTSEVHNVYGGSEFGTTSPAFATITIGGQSYTFDGSYWGQGFLQNGNPGVSGRDEVYGAAQADASNFLYSYLYSDNHDFVSSLNFAVPLSYMAQVGDAWFGEFHISTINASASGQLTVQSVTVAAVPELSTWTMMLLGFGMIGASIRRKRVRRTHLSYL